MLVVDGLGGLPHMDRDGRSELEVAHTPNLDKLAQVSSCGFTVPVLPGITPGSGPGHLALFGYDPLEYIVGRGVLEAMGIGISLEDSDISARGNFCIVDNNGLLVDRRAGRISEKNAQELCNLLNTIQIPNVELSVYPIKEHRFVTVIKGESLGDALTDTDPQLLSVAPLPVVSTNETSVTAAKVFNQFVLEANTLIKNELAANAILLRGISKKPKLPNMTDIYKVSAGAIASYPMYRGVAKLLGMTILETGSTFEQEISTLHNHFKEFDFMYIHYKPTDTAGEDGDFDEKVKTLEYLDTKINKILELDPQVFIIAGDHSTPSIMAGHSWHPVPFLLNSKWTTGDGIDAFNERSCKTGSLGNFPANQVMLLGLGHAGKISKYGP